MTPEDCWSADAWWGVEEDATLVQSCVARVADRLPGALCSSLRARGGVGLSPGAVLDAPAITRVSFEAALSRFASLGFPGGDRFWLPRDAALTCLADTVAFYEPAEVKPPD